MQQMEATMSGLVEYVFRNEKNTKIYLNLPFGEEGIRNDHDLFLFFVDLLCKGLVLLYGNGGQRVLIDNLSFENIDYVKSKLKNAGVILNIQTKEVIGDKSIVVKPAIVSEGNTNTLKDYVLRIVTNGLEYNISFELLRH